MKRYLLWLCAFVPVTAAAQTSSPNPPGPYVVDIRGAVSGVPQDPSFFPPLPSTVPIPERGVGFEIGGHVYPFGVGPARVGVGASLMRVHAVSSREVEQSTLEVDTHLTTIAPQVSLNFGSSQGWSYLSAGVGQVRIRTAGPDLVLDDVRTSDKEHTRRSTNVGFGARWLMKRHLGFCFDVRFHIVAAGKTDVATPATTLVTAAAGISLK